MYEENRVEWINQFGWNNYKEVKPDKNSEVVIFYVSNTDEGTHCYEAQVVHENFIQLIDSPILYWINKPE